MKKAKVLIVAAILMALGNSMNAQSVKEVKNLSYDKGYNFDIELSCSIPSVWEFSSSHGYSFGNGLYVGGGAGFFAEFLPDYNSTPTYYIPVFAHAKYNFCNTLASPFIMLKAGVNFDVCNTGMNIDINPAIGLDIDRYSIIFGYEMMNGVWKHCEGTNSHYFKAGIGITI